jgi:quercetin dioxygenase-like cupin family protein
MSAAIDGICRADGKAQCVPREYPCRIGDETTMALPHASHLDVVNVSPLGEQLPESVSTSLIKTDRLQLLHLVLPAHKDVPEHHVDDECTIHCLEGVAEVVMGSGTKQLRAGNVIVLPARQRFSLRARTDCALLVTLLLEAGDAGDGGGDRVEAAR